MVEIHSNIVANASLSEHPDRIVCYRTSKAAGQICVRATWLCLWVWATGRQSARGPDCGAVSVLWFYIWLIRFKWIQVARLWQRDRASSINDFRWGSIWGYYRLKGNFPRHCNMTQFTLTHHMVNKPFFLFGLAAKYRSLTVAVINVAADNPLFVTLTGERSW